MKGVDGWVWCMCVYVVFVCVQMYSGLKQFVVSEMCEVAAKCV